MSFSRSLKTAVVVAALVLSGSAGLAPAQASEIDSQVELSTDCDTGLGLLSSTDQVEEAMDSSGEDMNFTCLGALVTATIPSGEGANDTVVAVNVDDGNVVDLTDVPESEYESMAPNFEVPATITSELVVGGPISGGGGPISGGGPVEPHGTNVSGLYRATGSEHLVWGQKTSANVVIWSRGSTLNLVTSVGSFRRTELQVSNTPKGNYQIAIEGTGEIKKHHPVLADPWIGSAGIKQMVYSTSTYRQTLVLPSSGPGKFYHKLINMKMNDRLSNKKFNVAGNIQMPRFECYKTVNCKFPNGKEAKY